MTDKGNKEKEEKDRAMPITFFVIRLLRQSQRKKEKNRLASEGGPECTENTVHSCSHSSVEISFSKEQRMEHL